MRTRSWCLVSVLTCACLSQLGCGSSDADGPKDQRGDQPSQTGQDAGVGDSSVEQPDRNDSGQPDSASSGNGDAGPTGEPDGRTQDAPLPDDSSVQEAGTTPDASGVDAPPDATNPSDAATGADVFAPADAGNSVLVQWGTGKDDFANSIASDSNGSLYVAGSTWATLGDTPNPSGRMDAYLAKFDSDLNVQWIRQFGATSDEVGRSITTDATGGIYVAGTTWGDLDGHTNPMPGSGDAFVVKYDSAGNKTWTGTWATSQDETARAVTVDASKRTYVVGTILYDQAFLCQFAADGSLGWNAVWGSNDIDIAQGVAVDSSGNVYVAGITFGTFEGKPIAGDADIFVTKFGPGGAKLGSYVVGTASRDEARAIAYDAVNDRLILTGTVGDSLAGNAHAGDGDIVVIALSRDLNPLWTRQVGTSMYDEGSAVAVDAQGNSWVSGTTNGTFMPSNEDGDATVLKYAPNGTLLWARHWSSNRSDWFYGMAVIGAVGYAAGSTLGTLGAASFGLTDAVIASVQ